jgi:hypothetical protein
MIRRAVIAAAALGAAGAACSAIIGADAEPKSVTEKMCICPELDFLGGPEACKATLGARLDNAQDDTRAAWLDAYVNHPCTTCDHVLYCYYLSPTCASLACSTDEQCCGKNPGEKGTCNDAGLCAQ